MKKILLMFTCLLTLFSCSKDETEEFFEDDSLCICEKYFNEYYSDYLIPSYQIKSLSVKDWRGQLLIKVTFFNEVHMTKITSTVRDMAYKYGKETDDEFGQWQSNGEQGLEIVCKHKHKRNLFDKYVK